MVKMTEEEGSHSGRAEGVKELELWETTTDVKKGGSKHTLKTKFKRVRYK